MWLLKMKSAIELPSLMINRLRAGRSSPSWLLRRSNSESFQRLRSFGFLHQNRLNSRFTTFQRAYQLNCSRSYVTYRRFGGNERSSHQGFIGTAINLLMYSKTARQVVVVTIIGGGILYVTHLEVTPISGRRRFMLFGPKIEQIMGDQQYRQLLQEYQGAILPDNHPTSQRVVNVMRRLIKVSNLPNLDWKIHVINDPRQPPNAFVLPGGKVFVFSSILNICQNDDGLATVLAHETAHQVARHSGEKLSKTPFYMAISLLFWAATGSTYLVNTVVDLLLEMPSSRSMESEADYIGLIMMSEACFDPEEAVRFWGRMEKASRFEPFQFMSTHPSNVTRINQIKEWMPQALRAREMASCHELGGFLESFNQIGGARIF
ncbi:peptidase family M48-domain-containing protein [Dipodascopsis uninucleata]